MSKHYYKILINDLHSKNLRFKQYYSYGHTKDICILIDNNAAEISFSMSVPKQHEDFTTFRSKLFLDAFKKVYLFHILEYRCSLSIKSITINIDGDERVLDKNCEHFPYLHSMIGDSGFSLGNNWSNDRIFESLIGLTKTKYTHDIRVSALFSFLASKEKRLEIDKFSCLWTSLNAYYNYYARCFELSLKERYHCKSEEIPRPMQLYGDDSKSISALMATYCRDSNLHTRKDRVKNMAMFHTVERFLCSLDSSESRKLYRSAYNDLKNSMQDEDRMILALKELISSYNQPVFVILLFEFPYYLRCNYFHGNTTTLLIQAYNETELALFHVVNEYLSCFLEDHIPKIFDFGILTNDDYETFMYSIRKKEGDKGYNNAIRLLEDKKQSSN